MEPCSAFSRQTLEQFLAGNLPEPESIVLEGHIQNCPPCHGVLRGLAGLADEGSPPPTTEYTAAALSPSVLERLVAACPARREAQPVRPDIPRYDIRTFLGKGGMGAVWLAFDRQEQREVALKVLPPPGDLEGDEEARLLNEAVAVSKLHHDGIVRIHDIGIHEGRPYLSLEWCPGGSLADRLRASDSPMPPMVAAGIVTRVATAVQHAHDEGIVHRDLKPENILLVDREDTPLEACRVKVADFGLAKRTGARGPTRTGVIAGTLAYISPEQLTSPQEVGPGSDVYALGVILYQLLTGGLPFEGDGEQQIRMKIVQGDPVPPQRLRPDLASDLLQTICLKCLRTSPARRYASAGELALDLERFIHGEKIGARPPSTLQNLAGWVARRQRTLALVTAACAAACLVGAWLWVRQSDADVSETREELRESLVRTLQDFDRLGDIACGPDAAKRAAFHEEFERKESLYTRIVERGKSAPKAREDLGDIYVRLAWLEALSGDKAEAAGYLTKGRSQFASLARDRPASASVRRKWANTENDLGLLHVLAGRLEEARPCYEEAIRLHGQLADESPGEWEYVGDLAASWVALGELAQARKDFAGAEVAFATACKQQGRWIDADPRNQGVVIYQARNNIHWGFALAKLGRDEQAEKALNESLRLLDRSVRLSPVFDLGESNTPPRAGSPKRASNLGQLLRPWDGATTVQRLIDHYSARTAARPADATAKHQLAKSFYYLAMVRFGVGWLRDGSEASRRSVTLYAELRNTKPQDVPLALEEAQVYSHTALRLMTLARVEEVEQWCDRGVTLLEGELLREDQTDRAQALRRDLYLSRAVARSHGPRSLDALRDFQAANRCDAAVLSKGAMAHLYAATVAKARKRLLVELVRPGRHAEAVAEANALARLPGIPGEALYDGACALGLAAKAAGDPASRAEYEARCVVLLRMAFAAGFGKDPIQKATGIFGDPVAHARQDNDLAAVRGRADFKELMAGLSKAR